MHYLNMGRYNLMRGADLFDGPQKGGHRFSKNRKLFLSCSPPRNLPEKPIKSILARKSHGITNRTPLLVISQFLKLIISNLLL